jgi:hypothetical protein
MVLVRADRRTGFTRLGNARRRISRPQRESQKASPGDSFVEDIKIEEMIAVLRAERDKLDMAINAVQGVVDRESGTPPGSKSNLVKMSSPR